MKILTALCLLVLLLVVPLSAQDTDVITPENVLQLTRIEQFGQGYPYASWSPDGNLLVVSYSTGLTIFALDTDAKRPIAIKVIEPEQFRQAFAWSPDSQLLAVGGVDGIWLYDAADWQAEPQWIELSSAEQDETHQALQWSPDGHFLISNGTTGLWVLHRSGETYTTQWLEIGTNEYEYQFHPVAASLLIHYDDAVHLWNLESFSETMTFAGEWRFAVSSDGQLLAVADHESDHAASEMQPYVLVVHVYDLQTGRHLTTFSDHTETVISGLDFSTDSRLLVIRSTLDPATSQRICSDFAAIRVWDIEAIRLPDYQPTLSWEFESINAAASNDMEIASDGTQFYTSRQSALRDLQTGDIIRELEHTYDGSVSARFSPDAALLLISGRLAGGGDNGLRVYDTQTGELLTTLADERMAGVFSPNGRWIRAASGGRIYIWEVLEDKQFIAYEPLTFELLRFQSNATEFQIENELIPFADSYGSGMSPDDSDLRIYTSPDGNITLETRTYSDFQLTIGESIMEIPNDTPNGLLNKLTMSADSTRMTYTISGWCGCGCGSRSDVAMWNLANGERIPFHPALDIRYMGGLAYSPNSLILAGSSGDTLYFWDALDGSEIGHLQMPHSISAFAFSRDGRLLYVNLSDYTVHVLAL